MLRYMDIRSLTFLLPALLLLACSKPDSGNVTPDPDPQPAPVLPLDRFYKGTTMCFASYMQDCGLVYRENGSARDPYSSVKEHGANIVRLQLDYVAFSNYNGATIDWQKYDRALADMKKAKAAGLEVFLTMKPDYDKFYESITDHNNLPVAWSGKTEAQIGTLLYDWVYGTLKKLHEAGVDPLVIAVGNEVNIGFLKPDANSLDAARTGRLLARGFEAVRKYSADCQVACASALHIANPAKAESFLNSVHAAGATDYDIIALSYYPGSAIGHTLPYNGMKTTVSALSQKFGKKVMVIETSYSFTTGSVNGVWKGDWCENAYNYPDWDDANNSVNYTPAKQREWLGALAAEIKDGGGCGLITWGTESLPDELTGIEEGHGKGLYTYPAAWAYGSTWENNSYWDFTDSNNLHEGIDWMKDISE